jgi:hypothetical protein
MNFLCRRLAALIALCPALPVPAFAQETQAEAEQDGPRPAAGVEVWASTDADQTDVIKLLGRALWNFEGRDEYLGIAAEKAWFTPAGGTTRESKRIYLDVADNLGSKWLWRARIGTDGDTVLGSASIRTADWKQNYFIEREVVETQQGLDNGIYYTFAGANFDLPVDDSNVFTVMAGLQEFTGDNLRIHLRGNYVRVVGADLGLSAQLRTRYYHSTHPGEFDYFSPEDYFQVLPVLQIRRFDSAGWMYQIAGGYGVQTATGAGWQEARFAELRIESPRRSRDIDVFLELQYSNTSLTGGLDYDYVVGRMGLTFAF